MVEGIGWGEEGDEGDVRESVVEDVDEEDDEDDWDKCIEDVDDCCNVDECVDVDEEHDGTVSTKGGEIEEDWEDEGDKNVEDVYVEGCSLGVEGELASQRSENPECQEGQGLEGERYQ